MGNSSLTARKAQSIIETSLVLVAAIAFLLGAFRIGLWYNKELAGTIRVNLRRGR